MYPPNLKSVALPVPGIRGGSRVANPQSRGRGGHRGSAMVPFERALVSSYWPSTVTFLLSLRVLEILPLLISSTSLFPHPSPVSPKFPQVPLGIVRSSFGCKEGRCWDNVRVSVISF